MKVHTSTAENHGIIEEAELGDLVSIGKEHEVSQLSSRYGYGPM